MAAPIWVGHTEKSYKIGIVAHIRFNISNFFRPVPVHPDPEIRFSGFFSMPAPLRVGHTKKITYIKSYMSYNWYFINLFVRPILLGAAILEKPDFRISGSG